MQNSIRISEVQKRWENKKHKKHKLQRKRAKEKSVRLNLIIHVLALFRDKFVCNTAFRNPVFRCESCKGSV